MLPAEDVMVCLLHAVMLDSGFGMHHRCRHLTDMRLATGMYAMRYSIKIHEAM